MWSVLIDDRVFDIHRCNELGQTFLAQVASWHFTGKYLDYAFFKPNLMRNPVKLGSDLNTVGDSGLMPLHYALLYDDYDLVKLLIELGANPNRLFIRENHSMQAQDAERRMFSIMALLQPWTGLTKDENGHTPRDIAKTASVGLLKEGENVVFP
ncbi:hypothetical protein ANO14919_051750 [Xylariales sp. No.14919]|nr:hypothetical protein ANO14919_051750 [Xylariales sp. No.14919]